MRILIVEDEPKMADLLQRGLEEENHSAAVARTGHEGLEAAEMFDFDAIVLDVMLPGMDGFNVARCLRERQVNTPILMLTARDAVQDIVRGLDHGADDYLTKPFAFAEFLARLRAVARRKAAPKPELLEAGGLTLDTAGHTVQREGRSISLTPTEYRLLELLMRNKGRVVTRSAIVDAIWGYEQEIENNTLDAFIKLLRGKVDTGFSAKLIQTVRGFGYSIR